MARRARVTSEGLTLQEEQACQAFLATGSEAQAYCKIYTPDREPTDGWVRSEAVRLFKKPHMVARVRELISQTAKASLYSSDNAMDEAKAAYDLAQKIGQPAAMVSAVTLRAKLSGHLIEKREVTSKRAADLSDEEIEEMLRKSLHESGYTISKAKES